MRLWSDEAKRCRVQDSGCRVYGPSKSVESVCGVSDEVTESENLEIQDARFRVQGV